MHWSNNIDHFICLFAYSFCQCAALRLIVFALAARGADKWGMHWSVFCWQWRAKRKRWRVRFIRCVINATQNGSYQIGGESEHVCHVAIDEICSLFYWNLLQFFLHWHFGVAWTSALHLSAFGCVAATSESIRPHWNVCLSAARNIATNRNWWRELNPSSLARLRARAPIVRHRAFRFHFICPGRLCYYSVFLSPYVQNNISYNILLHVFVHSFVPAVVRLIKFYWWLEYENWLPFYIIGNLSWTQSVRNSNTVTRTQPHTQTHTSHLVQHQLAALWKNIKKYKIWYTK